MRPSVPGADATVRIDMEHVGTGSTDAGLRTGNDALDEAWIIEGSRTNATQLPSAAVQSALMDVSVPASVRITADSVAVRVPFTRLAPGELATLARFAGTMAERLERLGRGPIVHLMRIEPNRPPVPALAHMTKYLTFFGSN